MGLLGTGEARRTQFYLRDDGKAIFRPLLVEDNSLTERLSKDSDIIRAWQLPYKLQKHFPGYGNIAADEVTVCFDRDIIFDPFNQLSDAEKPEKGSSLIKKSTKDMASYQCYKHEHGKHGGLLVNRIILFLGLTLLLQVMAIIIRAALVRG